MSPKMGHTELGIILSLALTHFWLTSANYIYIFLTSSYLFSVENVAPLCIYQSPFWNDTVSSSLSPWFAGLPPLTGYEELCSITSLPAGTMEELTGRGATLATLTDGRWVSVKSHENCPQSSYIPLGILKGVQGTEFNTFCLSAFYMWLGFPVLLGWGLHYICNQKATESDEEISRSGCILRTDPQLLA